MAPNSIDDKFVIKGTGAKRPGSVSDPKSNNGYYEYGLTVRHNPKYKPGGDLFTDTEKKVLYERLIGWFEAKGLKLDNIYYEQKNGLHFHARALHKKKIYFKSWQKKPFHILFNKIYDRAGWLSYCQKEKERAQLDYFMNHYAFSSDDSQ